MSNGNVELTPDQLRRLGTDTRSAADRIDRILGTLKAARPGGAPWGDDSYGRQFAEDHGGRSGYVAASGNLDTDGANIVATIRSYADGITTAAANADTDEQNSADQFAAAAEADTNGPPGAAAR